MFITCKAHTKAPSINEKKLYQHKLKPIFINKQCSAEVSKSESNIVYSQGLRGYNPLKIKFISHTYE